MRIVKLSTYDGPNGSRNYKIAENGKKFIKAFLVSDVIPDGFPDTEFAMPDGWPSNFELDTMSILQILDPEAENKVYIKREDGTWQASDSVVMYVV